MVTVMKFVSYRKLPKTEKYSSLKNGWVPKFYSSARWTTSDATLQNKPENLDFFSLFALLMCSQLENVQLIFC